MNTALKLPHKLPYLERFVFSAILLAFPVLSLLLRGATSVLFFVLGAICLDYLLKDKSLFFPEKKDDDTMAFCFGPRVAVERDTAFTCGSANHDS